MSTMHSKDGQLEFCLAHITKLKPFQDFVGSPGSDRADKVQLVTDIVCNLHKLYLLLIIKTVTVDTNLCKKPNTIGPMLLLADFCNNTETGI